MKSIRNKTIDFSEEDGEDEYDFRERVTEKLFNDEDLYLEILKQYIAVNY